MSTVNCETEQVHNKPATLPVQTENIPEILRSRRRWFVWNWKWNADKNGGAGTWDKECPLRPQGGMAKSNDPSTWTTFPDALAACEACRFDGLGVMLGALDEVPEDLAKFGATGLVLIGADCDDVRDPDSGEVEPWAQWVIVRLDSYSEISPSLTGAKILCWGKAPTGHNANNHCGLEIHQRQPYCLTGQRLTLGDWTAPLEIRDGTKTLAELHAEFMGKGKDHGSPDPQEQRALALEALAHIPERALDYWDWLYTGMALHAVDDSSAMLSEWDSWSRQHGGDKYDAECCAKKWPTFTKAGGLGIGSLVHWAKQNGFKPRARSKSGKKQERESVGPAERKAILDRIAHHDDSERILDDEELLIDIARLWIDNPAQYTIAKGRCADLGIGKRDLDRAVKKYRDKIIAETPFPEGSGGPYEEKNGCTYRITRDNNGLSSELLSKFTARIVEQVIIDNGNDERAVELALEDTLANKKVLPRIQIPSDKFQAMRWPIPHWGSKAIVCAGSGTSDHLRCAIQELSQNVSTRTVYSHLGWRQFVVKNEGTSGGESGEESEIVWLYLHAGGGIGAKGLVTEVQVQPPVGLRNFILPEPPEDTERADAILASIDLLELAPDRIMVPLLGDVYRAPLGMVDFSAHLTGATGVGKSELASLMQQHFGPGMDRRHLPANWSSTENALESLAFHAKDALLTIDDFAPSGTVHDQQRFHKAAERVFRAQGNNSGRARCKIDGGTRGERWPRGSILSTGEDLARGESVRARVLILEISKGDVHLPELTTPQRQAAEGLYARTMAGYLQWLAPRYSTMQKVLQERVAARRQRLLEALNAQESGTYARTPGILAELYWGWECFLHFAVDAQALSTEKRDELLERVWNALLAIASTQHEHIAQSEVTRTFLELIVQALASGRCHLDAVEGGEPDDSLRYGWVDQLFASKDGTQRKAVPQGLSIGWIDNNDNNNDIYLIPAAAYAECQRFAQQKGESIPVSQDTLWKRLREKNLLASREAGKNVTRRTIQGARQFVIHLDARKLFPQA
jgi:hypothetical protein